MTNEAPSEQSTELSWLLRGLVERVPHTRSALLLSSDGLQRSAYGLDKDAADHLAALASGLHSLARGAGVRFDDGGEVRQVVAELSTMLLFVCSAGRGALLAVFAERAADASVLGYEMATLIKSVRPHLASRPRQPVR